MIHVPKKGIYWALILVALFVILDEWFKFSGLQHLPNETNLLNPGPISFAIHKNLGIAFDFPFRLEFIILISLMIGAGLLHIAYKNHTHHPDISFASLMIILGALGNLYDRIVYGFTVDYIILFARSAINLSDVVIVSGVILLLLASRRTRAHKRIHPEEPSL